MTRALFAALLAVSASGCGLVNALTGGENGSPFLQSNCFIDNVCDCYGVGCVCSGEALSCECWIPPDCGVICEVYAVDGSESCSGDTCFCDVDGCGCTDASCVCAPDDCSTGPAPFDGSASE